MSAEEGFRSPELGEPMLEAGEGGAVPCLATEFAGAYLLSSGDAVTAVTSVVEAEGLLPLSPDGDSAVLICRRCGDVACRLVLDEAGLNILDVDGKRRLEDCELLGR